MKRLTAARLREVLRYNKRTGVFTWRISVGSIMKGSIAGGTSRRTKKTRICIDGRIYIVARLAWLYVKGTWPVSQIDHKDRNPSNNKFENLREATASQNCANRTSKNKHGLKGITFREGVKKPWRATIMLGNFSTKQEAHAAYMAAARKQYGQFASAS